ncbi:MAG: chitobiase/beta-hexosaminidase C-terminal domain-containing protein [Bergeyella sp.]
MKKNLLTHTHTRRFRRFLLTLAAVLLAQVVWGQILSWSPSSSTASFENGKTPTAAANLTATDLVRGSGLGTSGSAAGYSYGGSGADQTTLANAVTYGDYFTTTVKANEGYTLSITGISTWYTRKSGSGTMSVYLQYSLDGSTFTDIGNASITSTSSGGATTSITFPTEVVTALSDLPSTTTVTFRFVIVSSTSANVYLHAGSSSAYTDRLVFSGSVNTFTKTSKPTFSPVAGSYTAAQNITLASATSGAAIYYTTDGTDPTTSSTLYTGAFSVYNAGGSTTVKAIAVKDGLTDSDIASAVYTFPSSLAIAAPTALSENTTLNGGTVNLTLTNAAFAATLDKDAFTLNNAPGGVTIASVTRNSDTTATISLAYDGTDFDSNYASFSITANQSQLVPATALTSGSLTITAVAESLASSGTLAFGTVCNGSSSELSFTLTGSNLKAGTISLGALAGYTYSETSGGEAVTEFYFAGGTLSKTIYVKLTPTAANTSYAGNISISSSGAASIDKAVTGNSNVTNPAVATNTATSITASGALLRATSSTFGICPATTAKGFLISETSVNAAPVANGTGVTDETVTLGSQGAFTKTVTLSPGTAYSYRAYLYNGTDYTYGDVQTFTTPAAEPTTQATNLVFSDVTSSSIKLSWTNGNGAGRIVVARQSSATTTDPTDGTVYTANSQFNNGQSTTATGHYVVYNGTENEVTVTGLAANTVYSFSVYEYNGSGTSANYNGTELNSTRYTLATEPNPATTVTINTITPTGFKIEWSGGSGSNALVVVKQGSAVDAAPADGTSYTANTVFGSGTQIGTGNYVVYSNTASSVTISGLTHSTEYHVAVYKYAGTSTGAQNYTATAAVASATTATPPENDDPSGAIALTINAAAVTGTNINSTKTSTSIVADPTTCTGGYTSNSTVGDVWYKVNVPANHVVTVTTSAAASNTITDTTVALYTLSGTTFTQAACDDDSGTDSYSSVTYTNGASAIDLYVRVWEYGNDSAGNFNIQVTAQSPTITAGTPAAMTAVAGASATQTIAVSGINLEGAISITNSNTTQFSVSPSSLGTTGGNIVITYSPTAVGSHTATVTLSSSNAANVVLTITGTAGLATPTATEAKNIGLTSFTASWNEVAGAESYELDVYKRTGTVTEDVTVVGWSFPVDGASSLQADEGLTANVGKTITTNTEGTITYPDGITTKSVSSNTWTSGSNTKYWEINFATTGMKDMTLSSVQRSSNTGPKDFKVQYKIGTGGTYTDLPNATVVVANNWTSGVLTNVSLPSACENQALVYIRWIMTSNNAVDGTLANAGTSRIENISIKGDQDNTVTTYILSDENVGNVTSYNISGLDRGETYYYVVRAVSGTVTTANSNEIEVTTVDNRTTWQSPGAWSNNAPDENSEATIAYDYGEDDASFETKTLTVNTGITVKIGEDKNITAEDVTNNGTIEVQNGGSFIHTGTFTAGENSKFAVRAYTKPVKRLAYISWSSPLNGSTQTLKAFSYGKLPSGSQQSVQGTKDDRFYEYNSTGTTYVQVAATSTFAPAGKGFHIRTPNDFDTTSQVFYGYFEGTVPNGGSDDITYSTTTNTAEDQYVFLGNPYPGALDIDAFRSENGNGTVYIWDSQVPGNNLTGTLYHTWTNAGSNPENAINGKIATGQGFFITSTEASQQFVFSNSMRATEKGTFQKAASLDRFWLQLDAPSGDNAQLLLAFSDQADAGYNKGWDAKVFDSGKDIIYTRTDNAKLTTDVHNAFADTDSFKVTLNALAAGTYTIGLASADGVFSSGQSIYLKDTVTGLMTNLGTSSYSFDALGGEEVDRFEVLFTTESTLGTTDTAQNGNTVIYGNKQTVLVKSSEKIKTVSVYDFSGRMINTAKFNSTTAEVPVLQENTVVVSVELWNGTVVTKKVKL